MLKTIGSLSLAAIGLAFAVIFALQSMIALNRPVDLADLKGDPRFARPASAAARDIALPTVQNFEARDRSLVGYRLFRSSKQSHIKLYLLHSEAYDELELAPLAAGIAYDAGLADVITTNIRGHGESPRQRGDTSYVGQPTDDLEDLIASTARPGDIVVIGGHSEGAAVAARLATAERGPKIDGVIFIAPVLTSGFPANRPNLGGWLMPLKWRMTALSVQNAVGLHWSDDETAVQYAVPISVREKGLGYAVTTDYSWRLYQSMQMRNADASDLARLKAPLLVITGTADQMLDVERLKPALERFVKGGDYAQVEGETHFGLVKSTQTLAIIQNWLAKLQ